MYPTALEELLNPHWSRDFLRRLPTDAGNEYDINYLLNQADAHNYFYNWFLNSHGSSYPDMLRKQHRLACLGANLNRPYKIKGYFRSRSGGNNNWDERDSFPGKLRLDLRQEKVSHPACDMLRVNREELKFISSENYFAPLYCNEKRRLDFNKSNGQRGPLNCHCLVESSGNNPLDHHFKFYKNGYFRLNHPVDDEYLIYMENVAGIMCRLVTLDQSKNHFFDLLAEYYHNAINWMPFAHVNNSLFMGQINVLLRHYNFKTVPHSKLDVYALLTSTGNFVPLFTDYVSSFQ